MKEIFVVSYDLEVDESDEHYQRVFNAIKQCGHAVKIQKSVWILESAYSTQEVRNHVQRQLDAFDELFVGKITEYASNDMLSPNAIEMIALAWHPEKYK